MRVKRKSEVVKFEGEIFGIFDRELRRIYELRNKELGDIKRRICEERGHRPDWDIRFVKLHQAVQLRSTEMRKNYVLALFRSEQGDEGKTAYFILLWYSFKLLESWLRTAPAASKKL